MVNLPKSLLPEGAREATFQLRARLLPAKIPLQDYGLTLGGNFVADCSWQ